MDTVRINDRDNVEVSLSTGHKSALCDIKKGEDIIKYGYPIGVATEDISAGEHVHSHNMKTKLGDILSYQYTPVSPFPKRKSPLLSGHLSVKTVTSE